MHYIWFRDWPYFEPSFPFAEYDLMDAEKLDSALTTLAIEWHARNPGAIEDLRLRAHRKGLHRDARANVLASTDVGHRRPTPPKAPPTTMEMPPSFREVAPLAGWVQPPGRVRVGPAIPGGPFGPYRPGVRRVFHACQDEASVTLLLDVLRLQVPTVATSGGTSIMRFGVLDHRSFSRAAIIDLEIKLQEYLASPWKTSAADAAIRAVRRIETYSDQAPAAGATTPATDGVIKQAAPAEMSKPRRRENLAATSYERVLRSDPELHQKKGRSYGPVYQRLMQEVRAGHCPEYWELTDLPSLGTWTRYVSEGLRNIDAQAAPADPPEPGSSVARRRDL